MLTVVGGIGAVGGALFGAASLLVLLPLLATLLPSIARWVVLLPGGAGIALGRNPNGAVHDIREGFAPLFESRRMLIVTGVALAGVYAVRLADIIDNWMFVIASLVVFFAGTAVANLTQPKAVEAAAGVPEAEIEDVPLEWRGIDRPWTDADREELDRQIGLSEVELHGVA